MQAAHDTGLTAKHLGDHTHAARRSEQRIVGRHGGADGRPPLLGDWGILPQRRIGEIAGLEAAAEPFRRFMAANVREDDLAHFIELANLPAPPSADAAPYRALVPAFMVSELRRGFEIGFLLFLPFLVIDMVVASVLMSLGMMMLPPSVVALPFKLIFFVLVDGWRLVSASLVQGFAGM